MKYTVKVRNGDPVISTEDNPNISLLEQKAERNAKLADSDPMMVSDRGLTDAKKAKWVTYRQALRDMDFSDLDNLNWPTKPE
tara:strand:- start:40 stop:285 length:246 start_codon:yes stop_codon:yes gene_type:complete